MEVFTASEAPPNTGRFWIGSEVSMTANYSDLSKHNRRVWITSSALLVVDFLILFWAIAI